MRFLNQWSLPITVGLFGLALTVAVAVMFGATI